MRVYLPATFADLATLRATSALPGPRTGCAVTPALREWFAEGDEDELEFAAMARAAELGLALLTVTPRLLRRVVVVADLEDADVSASDLEPAAVVVAGDVPIDRIASLHVDELAAESAIERALAALAARPEGSQESVRQVEDLIDVDLLWYATQELDDLLD